MTVARGSATTNGAGHILVEPIQWQSGDLCSWRREGEKRWKKSHVLSVLSDKDGSVRVWDKRVGFPACVPNRPENIRRRIA